MTTHPVYDRIIANLNRDTEEKNRVLQAVYHVLNNHVGKDNAISLEDLTQAVFPGETLTITIERGKPVRKVSETKMRVVREAIETMRNQPFDIPVCSNSGKAGRYLPATIEELFECSAEYIARGSKDIATGRNMERVSRSWFAREIPAHHIPASVEQAELFPAKRVEYA